MAAKELRDGELTVESSKLKKQRDGKLNVEELRAQRRRERFIRKEAGEENMGDGSRTITGASIHLHGMVEFGG